MGVVLKTEDSFDVRVFLVLDTQFSWLTVYPVCQIAFLSVYLSVSLPFCLSVVDIQHHVR